MWCEATEDCKTQQATELLGVMGIRLLVCAELGADIYISIFDSKTSTTKKENLAASHIKK